MAIRAAFFFAPLFFYLSAGATCADCFTYPTTPYPMPGPMPGSNTTPYGGSYNNPYGYPGGGGWGMGVPAGPGMSMGGPPGANGKKSTASQMTGVLSGIVDKIPSAVLGAEEKGAFKKYLELLGGETYAADSVVGSGNVGLSAYFMNLWGAQNAKVANLNQCFRDKAVGFYRDVSLFLKKQQGPAGPECSKPLVDQSQNLFDYGCPQRRPGLMSKAGDKEKPELGPGWVWKLALKHANGNPHAAMHLIGMCGHDDTAQGTFGYFDQSESARIEILAQVDELNAKKQAIEKEVKEAAQNVDHDVTKFIGKSQQLSFLMGQIGNLRMQNGKFRLMACPMSNTDYYLPGGLGDGADISTDLKQKINKIQNPEGKLNIPAKYYHVFGSAFMTCHLISNGFDAQKAVTVQKQAARIYRGIRMCGTSSELLQQREKLEDLFGKEAKKSEKSIEDYMLSQLSLASMERGCKAEKKETLKRCEALLEMFGGSVYGMQRDQEMAKRKIANRIARIDAARLYNSWYLGGGEFFGKKIPCTDIRLGGPSDLLNVNKAWLAELQRPRDWSKERYDAAAKHLATWDVDFEWTIAAHEAGAKFAGEHCKKGKPGENPFEKMCEDRKADQEKDDSVRPVERSVPAGMAI